MKYCRGCRYLDSRNTAITLCTEALDGLSRETNPTTGEEYYKQRYKYGLRFSDTTTSKCREVGMPCGPDAKLYQPKFLKRLIKSIVKYFKNRRG